MVDMKINFRAAFFAIISVVGLLISLGAMTILGAVLLGAIAFVGTSAQLSLTSVFRDAVTNTSNAFAGIFGVQIPNLVTIAVALLPIGIIVTLFGFLLFRAAGKGKGGSDVSGQF